MAARARPHADTRYWDNLPDTVHVYLADLPEGKHQLKVNFKDADGNIIGSSSRTIDFRVQKDKPSILWLRSPLHTR